MGRPYKVPSSIKELVKKKTQWKKVVTTLNKMALGGYETTNGNNITYTAQPNLQAMQLLIFIAWGKPTESGGEDVTEDLSKISEWIRGVNTPTKSTTLKKTNNTQEEKQTLHTDETIYPEGVN